MENSTNSNRANKYCIFCGGPLQQESTFCPSCGAKANSATETAVNIAEPVKTAAEPPAQVAVKTTKMISLKAALILAVVLIAVTGTSVALITTLPRDNSEPVYNEKTEETTSGATEALTTSVPEETAALQTTSAAETIVLEEIFIPEPVREEVSVSELEGLEEYVEIFSFPLGAYPCFDNINEVPLSQFLTWGMMPSGIPYDTCDSGQIERARNNAQPEWGVGNIPDNSFVCYEPEAIEAFIKEAISPEFSIESYDYRNLVYKDSIYALSWDDETETIVKSSVVTGFGGFDITYEFIDAYKLGDYYYAITMSEGVFEIHKLKKNENGNWNIYSKQEYDGELPEWTEAAKIFVDFYRASKSTDNTFEPNYDYPPGLFFIDLNNDGRKEIIFRSYTDREVTWVLEIKNGGIDVKSFYYDYMARTYTTLEVDKLTGEGVIVTSSSFLDYENIFRGYENKQHIWNRDKVLNHTLDGDEDTYTIDGNIVSQEEYAERNAQYEVVSFDFHQLTISDFSPEITTGSIYDAFRENY